MAETHAQPPGQNRWRNELDFQILYSSTSLAIFLQYGLTLLAIGDEDLQQSSNVLYALSLLTWGAWGINVGINRALQGFRENLRLLPVAPPLSRQVLMQSVIQNF